MTPRGKKILIDGGEANQNILVPYLLARKIKTLDFVIVSHFDSDHSGALREVVENLNVKCLIISKQIEESEECNKMIEIAKEKKLKIIFAEVGKRINIEKNIFFDVIWPCEEQITENPLNNNSIVCKLNYINFSMLFTGDIEEIAEKQIVSIYGKSNVLNSTVLKIAHHGSNTSSTEDFLNLVKPKIGLIGVRKK